MDDHVSGLPKLVVPGKVNWELQDTFHIKTADAIVRISWDRDSYYIVKATEGDVASRVIAAVTKSLPRRLRRLENRICADKRTYIEMEIQFICPITKEVVEIGGHGRKARFGTPSDNAT